MNFPIDLNEIGINFNGFPISLNELPIDFNEIPINLDEILINFNEIPCERVEFTFPSRGATVAATNGSAAGARKTRARSRVMALSACKDRERFLRLEGGGGYRMGTINQPIPSNPKSPQPDQQPLQPGGPKVSRDNAADISRPNHQTPDTQKEKVGR